MYYFSFIIIWNCWVRTLPPPCPQPWWAPAFRPSSGLRHAVVSSLGANYPTPLVALLRPVLSLSQLSLGSGLTLPSHPRPSQESPFLFPLAALSSHALYLPPSVPALCVPAASASQYASPCAIHSQYASPCAVSSPPASPLRRGLALPMAPRRHVGRGRQSCVPTAALVLPADSLPLIRVSSTATVFSTSLLLFLAAGAGAGADLAAAAALLRGPGCW